ncbi:MAG: tRNA pseudouridine(38-40) synthase TruA [Betaproteobacteria bacterium]|nr:tRNA pseudouridine(38-40) synthase TruA [Betaproteobacteria bacterium]
MRIAVGLEYDGAAFCGWQTQPSACSVQNAFEAALAAIAGVPVASVCAGRTDAGVHALGQVAHFDVAVPRPLTAWVRGVNTFLPPTIAVTWARQASTEFHARYSARSRTYRYVLLNRGERPGVMHRRVGWYHHALDLDAMREAAQHLVGEHDFSAFRSAECQSRSAVRRLFYIEIQRVDSFVTFDVRGNAFLHNMVRIIVGCLIEVGAGKRSPAWLAQVRDARERARAAATADAAGLYLVGVNYDEHLGLPHPALAFAPGGDGSPVSCR